MEDSRSHERGGKYEGDTDREWGQVKDKEKENDKEEKDKEVNDKMKEIEKETDQG